MGSVSESTEEKKQIKPLGIRFIEYTTKSKLSFKTHQAIVLIVTFLAYASYHATRKTTSIVKTALDPQSPDATLLNFSWRSIYSQKPFESKKKSWILGNGWAPFNGSIKI